MLNLFNVLIFQWFCLRLVRCTRKVYTFRGSGVDKHCSDEYFILQWFSIAGWIVPLTGWWGSYYTFGSTKQCGSTFPWMWRITWRRNMGVYNSKQV